MGPRLPTLLFVLAALFGGGTARAAEKTLAELEKASQENEDEAEKICHKALHVKNYDTGCDAVKKVADKLTHLCELVPLKFENSTARAKRLRDKIQEASTSIAARAVSQADDQATAQQQARMLTDKETWKKLSDEIRRVANKELAAYDNLLKDETITSLLTVRVEVQVAKHACPASAEKLAKLEKNVLRIQPTARSPANQGNRTLGSVISDQSFEVKEYFEALGAALEAMNPAAEKK